MALEGIDGSGTTTHARLLVEGLRRTGLRVVLVEEPSRGPIGQLIRRFMRGEEVFDQKVLALLFAADRLLLHRGVPVADVVVGDRSWVSSLVYQSLDLFPDAAPLDWVYTVNRYAPRPDLLVFLDVDPVVAYKRLLARRGREVPETKLSYLRGLARRYREVVEALEDVLTVFRVPVAEPEPPVEAVAKSILAAVLAVVAYKRGRSGLVAEGASSS